MGDKSIQKKKLIVSKAKEVFSERGYLEVTMKDIVDACEISRGGLYLYFDNINDLFLEVLRSEEEKPDEVFAPAIQKDATGADILALFLKEQKREIVKGKHGLTAALYEYYFHTTFSNKENKMRQDFQMAVKLIESLIKKAVDEGDFVCDNPKAAARQIMYVLEGLRIASLTMGVTEADVDQEIIYILKDLVRE